MSQWGASQQQVLRLHQDGDFRPVAVARIVNAARRILFVQSAEDLENWGFPQGGIERGECPLEAAFREVEEEVGISSNMLSTGIYLGEAVLNAPEERTNRRGFRKGKHYFFFAFTYCGSDGLRIDPAEIADYRWVRPNEVDQTLATTRPQKVNIIKRFL